MIELLRIRRSVRKFTTEKVDAAHLETIIEAALRSPSSRGINPWEFVVVDDPLLLNNLAGAKQHGSEFLRGAPLAVVVCADSTASDVWVEDCSIAAIIIQLTSLSLGLGTCWAQIRNRRHDRGQTAEEYIRALLGMPEHMVVEAVIGIGHPAENKRPVAASALQREKVRRNSW